MPSQDRRRFLKRAGGVSIAGIAFAIGGAGATDRRAPRETTSEGVVMHDQTSPGLPDNPEEYETEHWPSFRADVGNTGYVATDHEFGECVGCDWRSDIRTDSITDVVIADDTVYVQNEDRVSAFAVDDGAVEWHSDDIAASGSPTVAYATVFIGGDELTALDVEDGSDRWQSSLDAASSSGPGPGAVPAPTVAYGAVYVVVDATLYAFEASDGSIRWERESVTVRDGLGGETEMTFDRATVAAVNESVYAAVGQGIVALDPGTGETAWTNRAAFPVGPILASSDRVGVRSTNGNLHLYDAETGEFYGELRNFFLPSLGEDVVVTTSEFSISATDLESDDRLWSISGGGTQAIGPPTVVGETVYVYFSGRTPQYQNSVVAIDKYDGTVKWAFELTEETTENRLLAFSDGTLYVSGGNVTALR